MILKQPITTLHFLPNPISGDLTMSSSLPSLHHTTPLHEIAVDYTPSACHHSPSSGEIHLTFDHRLGSRWRSPSRFLFGTFSALIRCPSGDTSGLNSNLYLSSLEGHRLQDEIDFEFLGNDRNSVQTNFYVGGIGGRERVHLLGFDASEEFHEYAIRWDKDEILWSVDGEVVRREGRREGERWLEKGMFLYASVWDASEVDEGRWAGKYGGGDAPYVCVYRDVKVPVVGSLVVEEEEEEGDGK